MQRNPKAPTLTCLPRSSVDASALATVDTTLKQLKAYSRRLKSCLDAYQTELSVLTALHYKGRNQHRSSVFWRRIVEARRYGDRVCKSQALENVKTLQCSFFGLEAETKSKLLRGSWTHVPSTEFISFVEKRMQSFLTLASETHNRLVNIHSHLSQAMKSSAFLQHILTFSAIISRMDILAQELVDLFKGLSSVCANGLAALSMPVQATSLKALQDEDTPAQYFSTPAHQETEIEPVPTPLEAVGTNDAVAMRDTAPLVLSSPENPFVQAPALQHKETTTVKATQDTEISRNTVKPKKKKKRDAIDAIFGF